MPLAPWDDHRTPIAPDEYEREVAKLLLALGADLPAFSVQAQERVQTAEGDFRIDVMARFTQLGVDFLVLIECKDHARPVGREDVQVLADRMRAARAQKGMLFSTNGFQRGAIEYAKANRIALVRFLEGSLTYETKAERPPGTPRPIPPPWADVPRYLGIVTIVDDHGRWTQSVFESKRTQPIVEFLVGLA